MRVLALILAGAALAGCAANDPYRNTKTGAAVGAAGGAAVGAIAGKGKGAALGAIIGAVGGALVGDYMDDQQKAMEQQLAAERRANALEIERMKDDTLKVSLSNEVSFARDSADLTPTFQPSLDKLADVLNRYERTVVHVVGHTDSDGSDNYNLRLSERRAGAVGSYLVYRGVPQSRVRMEGRGEREPRATNATAAGKQLNRRVEIYVKPVVEGEEQRAYEPPRYAG